jgi:hypothetical protein
MIAERTPPASPFQTPPRILIPKLLRSRDDWKAKATRRKHEGKALRIRIRDLTASRLRHRLRADRLARENEQLRLRLEHVQQQLDQLRQQHAAGQTSHDGPAPASAAAPKKTRP